MIRTGDDYRDSIRDGREVFVNGEKLRDVTTHPMFRPLVDIRAKIYDMAHAPETAGIMTVKRDGDTQAIGNALPFTQADWWAKRRATDLVLDTVGGIVTRVGDETAGEMWSLYDAKDALHGLDPQFSGNIANHIAALTQTDPFHVSANTDPKLGQGSEMRLHVVRETDAGIVVRGAKYETAAAYANQAFTKPTISDWGNGEGGEYALGFICDLSAPGLKFICRTGFAGRASAEDYPLSNRFDEIDTLVIFDDVLIPWENVLFYRSVKAAMIVRATLHRYSAFAFLQRSLKFADMMIGAALLNLRQSGLDRLQPVQEKLAQLACYREGINAHLSAALAMAERSPGGLMMPNQSLLYTGRVLAGSQLAQMMHLARELCGGQVSLTPDIASFKAPETAPWLDKVYALDDEWIAEDRRKLLAFARDLLNSDHAGHRLSFQLFAQSPPYAHLASVYRNFDWDGPIAFVKEAAGLSERVMGDKTLTCADSPTSRWFSSAPQAVETTT
ncbi:4-hydroxyphenylacetate 3-hydroxylase family protein [Thioclava sp.]|uniref:4-hydroxyphenylacetate 3-hydroxylase family protein n=1 Tax=Thioclava sp. TaxID=1933450 RepID=UPI003AA8E678